MGENKKRIRTYTKREYILENGELKKCLNCENTKFGNKNHKYCSGECASIFRNKDKREMRPCVECGTPFDSLVSRSKKERFCSKECSKKNIARPEVKKEKYDIVKKTNLERYGNTCTLQSETIKEKAENTNFERYGSRNVFASEEIKEKIKETNLERYGVEYVSQSEEIQEKIKASNLEKYGFDNPSKNEEVKNKIKKTNLEKYGVECSLQSEGVKNKIKETNLERYGFEYCSQNEDVKARMKETNLERYGVEYATQSEEIRQRVKNTNIERYGCESVAHIEGIQDRIKKTNLEKYGVTSPMQIKEICEKSLKNAFRLVQYKDTKLFYQGTYELHFLEQMENIGLLNNISKGNSYTYIFKEKKCMYLTDFKFGEKEIEIKSSWTYDRNGKDLELQARNEAKWQAVRDSGIEIIVLKSKEEIDKFIETLKK